jgi:hypothetical protein
LDTADALRTACNFRVLTCFLVSLRAFRCYVWLWRVCFIGASVASFNSRSWDRSGLRVFDGCADGSERDQTGKLRCWDGNIAVRWPRVSKLEGKEMGMAGKRGKGESEGCTESECRDNVK